MRPGTLRDSWHIGSYAILPALFLATLSNAAEYQFEKIVDSSGVYKSFTTSTSGTAVSFGPSINDNGDVLFTVELDNGHRRLELWTPEGTQTIATSTGLTPFRDILFALAPVFNNQRDVLFQAVSFTTGTGIFTGPDPAVDLIADQAGVYSNFGSNPAINNAGDYVIQASLPGGISGLYRGPDPEADVIVDNSGEFASFGQVALNDAGQMAFTAFLDGEVSGVFVGTDPVADRLVDSQGEFRSFNVPFLNNVGDRIFRGELDSGVTGLYRGADPIADRIVDTTMGFELMGGGWINDHRQFVFGARFDNSRTGIFSGPDPVADKIIATEDEIYGSTISALSAYKAMNNAGQIVFAYALANGEQGIILATPAGAGDYNGDGTVNAADYTIWRNSLNQSGDDLPADGNHDGTVDEFDYGIWKINYGQSSTDANAIPEPATAALLLYGIALALAKAPFPRRSSTLRSSAQQQLGNSNKRSGFAITGRLRPGSNRR